MFETSSEGDHSQAQAAVSFSTTLQRQAADVQQNPFIRSLFQGVKTVARSGCCVRMCRILNVA